MYKPQIITAHGYVLSHEKFITTAGRVLNINNNFPPATLMFLQFQTGFPNKALHCIISE